MCVRGHDRIRKCSEIKQTVENSERDGIPDHLTCLLRNCMQVKKQQLELDTEQQTGSKLGKEYVCILSPCLFNLYAEYIMPDAKLDETQAGIKIAGRNQ